tara:strand:- start:163 stop:351 length:189 start_codon:yes stop_codon:yes gene_type:complete
MEVTKIELEFGKSGNRFLFDWLFFVIFFMGFYGGWATWSYQSGDQNADLNTAPVGSSNYPAV